MLAREGVLAREAVPASSAVASDRRIPADRSPADRSAADRSPADRSPADRSAADRSSVANRPGQRVPLKVTVARIRLDRKSLARPVLESADQLFHTKAEARELERCAGGAVASGAPAVGDDLSSDRDLGGRASRDFSGGHVDGTDDATLTP